MADPKFKTPTNVPGAYYVDESCVDCDYCRNIAPAFFRRDDDLGVTDVYHQPATPEEIIAAEEGLQGCPTESIGHDGDTSSLSPAPR